MTNHQALTALFKQSNVPVRVLRWSLGVQRYKLEIKYVKGRANVVADALSRGVRVEGETGGGALQGLNEAVVNVIAVDKKTKWLEELEEDEDFSLVLDALRKDDLNRTVRMHGTNNWIRVAALLMENGDPKMCTEEGALRSSNRVKKLRYECKDGCLKETCFGDLKDIVFPGAFAKEPLGSLWRAWVAASILIRNDMNAAEKIKAWKKGVICLDAEALQRVLRLAYDRCKDWTEFLYVTDGISKHDRIDDYCFDRTYDEALKNLKRDLDEQEKNRRSKKQGPTAFAAPENALLLERVGSRRGIIAKFATSFEILSYVLDDLEACSTWIIVWPLDTHFTDAQICEILRRCHQQLEEGGRIVSVFPPLMESNQVTWRQLTELWQMIEGALQKKAGSSQFLSKAIHKIEGGNVFIEAGAPEGCLNYYGKNPRKGSAKALYECIRNCLKEANLPELDPLEVAPTRVPAPRGGGCGSQDHAGGTARVSRLRSRGPGAHYKRQAIPLRGTPSRLSHTPQTYPRSQVASPSR
ncbi:hypothetical protein V3C99_018064 [Haemonchus contortus]|uniref:Integrase catalytic domain-containing protein n=1 Tax=Haemonchus contortus TaxID=6289 RepID=A0A7I5EEI7_HAECO